MIKITKDWILILICSLITVLSWVGFEIYRVWNTPTVTPLLEEQMKPLNPELDQRAIEILREAGNP